MGKITEDELSMLSDEERAAIEGDTEAKSTEEIRAEEEAASVAQAKEDGAGAARRSEDAQKSVEKIAEEQEILAAAAKLREEEAAVVTEEVVEPVVEAEQQKPPAATGPLFTLESEKKFGTKEEIDAKMAELDTKFEDGDITLAAYNKERAEYVESLTEMKMFDKINAQVHKAAAEKGWKDSQANFFNDNNEYYSERIKNVAFVDAVNRLLATDESTKMTDAQIFDAAKKECDAVFYPNGRGKTTPDNVVDIEAKRKTVEDDKRKVIEAARKIEADRAAAIKTLAKVPVSEGNVGEDKFDRIDKLGGLAYEEAVAQLTREERMIYASRS
jgi:hypothetical protein